MGNSTGDSPYLFSRIPGHGMSSRESACQIQPVFDPSGGSQVVVIYAFHESLADYNRVTHFFAETLNKGLYAKK